jgi:hypothetical protein
MGEMLAINPLMNPIQIPSDEGTQRNILGTPMFIRISGRDAGAHRAGVFLEMAAIVNVGGPPDIEKIKAAMLGHGLAPALPQK